MSIHPDIVYGIVRERQQADRTAALLETRARRLSPRLHWRIAAMLRVLADRLDPEHAYSRRAAAEPLVKRQLYYSRALLARYDPCLGRVVYDAAGQVAEAGS